MPTLPMIALPRPAPSSHALTASPQPQTYPRPLPLPPPHWLAYSALMPMLPVPLAACFSPPRGITITMHELAFAGPSPSLRECER